MANILNAIIRLVNNPLSTLPTVSIGKNRANSAGDALEEYIKDLFAGTHGMSEQSKLQGIAEVFSYLGNASNPPDAMLKGGDALEVKKIENPDATLALNSSYPKHKLYADSSMISTACKNAEQWKEKDMLYIVGVVQKNTLKHLCMVYGSDYCASAETYERIKNTIKDGVESMPNIEFSPTKELGRVNKVDPLGVTYLRIRGMWGIENPWNVFKYVYKRDMKKEFNFMCIINEEKWNSFDNTEEFLAKVSQGNTLCIEDVRVKNPNNPAQLNNAKLITFCF